MAWSHSTRIPEPATILVLREPARLANMGRTTSAYVRQFSSPRFIKKKSARENRPSVAISL